MIVHIEWQRGYMNINADKFFPCNIADFKKLLKIIDLDVLHREEIKENLKVYFQDRIPNLPNEAEAAKQNAVKYKKLAEKARKDLSAERKRMRNCGEAPYFETFFISNYEKSKELSKEYEIAAKTLLKSEKYFKRYLELLQGV